jgi:hypothetical protein
MPDAPFRHRARPLLTALLAPLAGLAVACQPPPPVEPPPPVPPVAVDPADYGAAPLGTTAYPVPAGARWVATDGDDTGPGTETQPWRTLAHAVAAAPGGATVVLRGGTYRETVEVPASKRLTIQSAAGEAVWLSGSEPVTGWVEAGGAWVRTGFSSPFGPGTLHPSLVTPSAPMAGDPDMVFVDGRPLRQVGARVHVTPGTFFVDDPAGALVIGDDPNGRLVEVATRSEALNVKSPGSVVRGIGFRHYATHISRLGAVKAGGGGITFENDVFVDNAAAGVSVMAPDVRIVRSTATGNGQLGIHGDGAHRLVVEGSLLQGNNRERFAAVAASGGIKVTGSDGIVLRRNLVEDNLSHGLWMDLGSDGATVVRNVARRNSAAGIIIEMSVNEVVASNVSVDNEVGVIISETSGASVWNNVLLGGERSIYVVDGWREPLPVDISIRNNVIAPALVGARPPLIVDDVNLRRSGSDMRVTSDRNAYYRRSTTASPYLTTWADYPAGKLVMRSITDVRSRTGQERSSWITDDAPSNPYVADAAAGRYGLPATSPLGAAGAPLSVAVAGALGLPPGSAAPVGVVSL